MAQIIAYTPPADDLIIRLGKATDSLRKVANIDIRRATVIDQDGKLISGCDALKEIGGWLIMTACLVEKQQQESEAL